MSEIALKTMQMMYESTLFFLPLIIYKLIDHLYELLDHGFNDNNLNVFYVNYLTDLTLLFL